jgi:phage shock protein C
MNKRLYRSHRQKMIAGVCGGLAEYFEVDVTLIRLLWALSFCFGGIGAFAYIVAVIIIPYSPEAQSPPDGDSQGDPDGDGDTNPEGSGWRNHDDKRKVFGLILVGLGLYFTANMFFPFNLSHRLWPLILVLVGIFLLFESRRK